ncbi:MAG: hypothetical protein A2W99_08810 [Bacteroidetes bacterium GWF2_33_16]|nr:MAG: hypothetical protein A2X00_00345 [Bacteroidetes bacterium GWE2_32_14]OFY05625.1 MAG: hypothetical protein A2W99_08810 [Bacteroidetes bacterium GWF2_33_16]
MKKLYLLITLSLAYFCLRAQPVPAEDENIPYLMTFGPKTETSWGDDDFSQTFFFVIPEEHTSPIFIRVFDPDVGGEVDEINGYWDSKVSYTIYGGLKCYTDPDAQGVDPSGNYRSGNMLATRVFGENPRYDNDWFTFGPFNPTEGELVKKYGGYIFKIICEGAEGDDGNMYRYFVSTSGTENKRIEGANAFAYEYSFRMHNDPNEVSHIYPYIDDRTISVEQKNFDWDADGLIRVVSVARQGLLCVVSNDDAWAQNQFKILEEEIGTSLDFQFIKKKSPPVKNNNVVISVKNQYGELLPFYTIPIGGVPKYKYSIGVKKKE